MYESTTTNAMSDKLEALAVEGWLPLRHRTGTSHGQPVYTNIWHLVCDCSLDGGRPGCGSDDHDPLRLSKRVNRICDRCLVHNQRDHDDMSADQIRSMIAVAEKILRRSA
jgi:hypothetical protein